MKKYSLSFPLMINIFVSTFISSCPHEFSHEDERPFFEQYETKINIIASLKEENKS